MARSRGSIRKRGKSSYEIKFDVPSADGARQTRTVNFKCKTTAEAKKELTRLLGTIDAGTFVEPEKLTVAGHVNSWIAKASIGAKTKERYQDLCDAQIAPFLGGIVLQKLRPAHIEDWHQKLLTGGGKDGAALSPSTVGHAHRLLRTAIRAAMASEKVSRNVVATISPPTVQQAEIEILDADEVPVVLAKLEDHWLHPLATTALGSGARRGELLALLWSDLDLEAGTMSITKALGQTRKSDENATGLYIKSPKTKAGRRTITLPANVVAALRAHRARTLELRLKLMQGKMPNDAIVFCQHDGSHIPPNNLSRDWARVCISLDLPRKSFHSLRHTHASALIAAGVDVMKISKRLGHSSAAFTLRTYGHLFKSDDAAVAAAMDKAMQAR
jgi:integrase